MKWRQRGMALGGLVVLLVLCVVPSAFAAQSSSANYQVNEVFFGSGGEAHACASTYCAKQTAGEIAAGNTAGAAFRAYGGFNTSRDPYLAFSTSGSSTDLGYLSQFGTATATASFAVKTYLASGYVVQIASDPPTNSGSGHQLAPLASPAAPIVGTEQFGMNLVRNTTSCGMASNFGQDAVQVPDNTFSFGTVASGYNGCGLFKYVKGDTVASSTKSSGETDYTISFIYNISNLTPNGEYNYHGTLVATSTF